MSTQTACDSKVLLMFAPLKSETEAVQTAVDHWTHDCPSIARSGSYDRITVECIGIRGSRLREVLPRYAHQRVAGVIVAGVAGALAPDLAIGDLVIDTNSTDADRVAEFMNAMSGQRRVCVGPIHTAKEIVTTAGAKKRLHKETKALAVDMENAYTRQLADRRGAAWLGIRAISDTAFENISPTVVHFVDGTGSVRPWDMTLSLARKPMLIPQLIRLGRNTQAATRHLSDAIGAVIRSGWPFQ
ncbi:MAG: hypothetical protein M0Z50_09685 [Planctomycetia bacterium]|jgi:hypothetical protein|nr:hypothetical protein [Planctomycetia bacterium]